LCSQSWTGVSGTLTVYSAWALRTRLPRQLTNSTVHFLSNRYSPFRLLGPPPSRRIRAGQHRLSRGGGLFDYISVSTARVTAAEGATRCCMLCADLAFCPPVA